MEPSTSTANPDAADARADTIEDDGGAEKSESKPVGQVEEKSLEEQRKHEIEEDKLMQQCSKYIMNFERFFNSSAYSSSSSSEKHTFGSLLYEKGDDIVPPVFTCGSSQQEDARLPCKDDAKALEDERLLLQSLELANARELIKKKHMFNDDGMIPLKKFCSGDVVDDPNYDELNREYEFKEPAQKPSTSKAKKEVVIPPQPPAPAPKPEPKPTTSKVYFMDYEDDDSEEEEAPCTCIAISEMDDPEEARVNDGLSEIEAQFHSMGKSNNDEEEDMEESPSKKIVTVMDHQSKPAEIQNWLGRCDDHYRFTSWTNSERWQAIDHLLPYCEAQQVNHMMKSMEPYFQRDFISLLPKELALSVLSYVEIPDLLRAAQTCRSWQMLADDKLLWKAKCMKLEILPLLRQPKAMPKIANPWKAAFLRQRIVERNWRTKDNLANAKLLKGHDEHVITCLQFKGNKILSGSDDTTLKLWSAHTGKCLRTLVGHTGGVWSCQMVGRVVVSGSTDRTLRIWDIPSGFCLRILTGHTSTVRCMDLHENRIVSGSRDTTLRIWMLPEGRCLHVLKGHTAAVRCVQFNGQYVISGAYDFLVKVWSPETGECLHTLTSHTNRVYSLQFDGVHIVSGSLDTAIKVWDVETGTLKHTLKGHQSLTSGMELRKNILVSGNADSTVKVWDILSGECLHTLAGPNKHVSAITCLQTNCYFVITSSDDGTVKLWDIKSGEFIRNLISLGSGGAGGVVWRIRASATKLICAVGSRNGTEETKLLILDFDLPGACLKCEEC